MASYLIDGLCFHMNEHCMQQEFLVMLHYLMCAYLPKPTVCVVTQILIRQHCETSPIDSVDVLNKCGSVC